MLRIHTQTSVDAAKSYYTAGLAREDYYSQEQETVGLWHGRAAARLGLSGEVTQAAFTDLCENKNPSSGERLTERTKTNRRVGNDFNFHVPKSVSVVFSQTQDPRILNAFREAVSQTMNDMEAEVQTRARASNRRVETGNLVWAEFIHTTARPVGGEPDPHLHAHCFTFNATWDENENRWKAAEFGDIKRDARYFEAAFHSRLSLGLADQGYAIRRTENAWELDGIPESVIDKFSRRTQQIESKAARSGITDPSLKAELGARTRANKAKEFTGEQLKSLWDQRLTPAEREAIWSVGSEPPSSGGNGTVNAEQAVEYAIDHEFTRASVVPERRVLETALRRSLGEVSVDQTLQAAESAPLLHREVNRRKMVSTKAVLEEERAMLEFARSGRGACAPLAAAQEIESQKLNEGQQGAVRHIWDSHDRVMVLRGGAGTGKTTLMKEAVSGIKAQGKRVMPLAPTAEASRGVLRKDGFHEAQTVAAFLQTPELQEQYRQQVLWIDEAGLLGTRDLGRVFETADSLGCRVVLCGDSKQHAAVSRGDALRLLETEAGIKPAEVTEIVRQRGSYKEAVTALSKGDAVSGFEQLDAMGAIKEVDEHERHELLAEEYLKAIKEGKTALVVSPTHAEGDRVTQSIRTGLRQEGRLKGGELVVPQLKSKGWTEAEQGDLARFQEGQIVQFHQHSGKAKSGERFRVIGTGDGVTIETEAGKRLDLSEKQARHFQVYESDFLPLASGELLRITRNGKTADGKHRLNNGATYRFTGFNESGDLQLDNGWVVARDYGHLAYGYVATSHASQGKTVDRVFAAQGSDSFMAANREQFYVSVSRARESVTVFTDDKAGLKEAVESSCERMSATELMRPDAEQAAENRWDRVKAHAVQLQQWALQARDYAGRQVEAAREKSTQWRDRVRQEREGPEPEPGQ